MPNKSYFSKVAIITLLTVIFAVAGCISCTSERKNEHPSEDMVVVFKTTEGDIEISLLPKNAPKACENFLKWCEGIEIPGSDYRDSLYLGNNFYNVEPNLFIQTGDVFNQGKGAEMFEFEYEKTDVPAVVGSVFFVKDIESNTNNSIFAILLRDNPKLEDVYTIFGRVTDGLDICYKISNVPTTKDEALGIKVPNKDIKINSVTIKNAKEE
ncbi:MAG: peptidylprolyl isomerase [Caldisericia bacterium]